MKARKDLKKWRHVRHVKKWGHVRHVKKRKAGKREKHEGT